MIRPIKLTQVCRPKEKAASLEQIVEKNKYDNKMTIVYFGYTDDEIFSWYGHLSNKDELRDQFSYYITEIGCARKYAKGKEGPAFVVYSPHSKEPSDIFQGSLTYKIKTGFKEGTRLDLNEVQKVEIKNL